MVVNEALGAPAVPHLSGIYQSLAQGCSGQALLHDPLRLDLRPTQGSCSLFSAPLTDVIACCANSRPFVQRMNLCPLHSGSGAGRRATVHVQVFNLPILAFGSLGSANHFHVMLVCGVLPSQAEPSWVRRWPRASAQQRRVDGCRHRGVPDGVFIDSPPAAPHLRPHLEAGQSADPF